MRISFRVIEQFYHFFHNRRVKTILNFVNYKNITGAKCIKYCWQNVEEFDCTIRFNLKKR